MTKETHERLLRRPKTVYDIVSKEEVDIELYKAGFSEEDLKTLRQGYFQPLNHKENMEMKVGEKMENKEEATLILKELREDLISDLNEYDPSVGLYPVNNLLEWSKDAFNDTSDVTVVSGSKTNLIFKFKECVFEIYERVIQVGEEEYDFSWEIREYDSTEETISE